MSGTDHPLARLLRAVAAPESIDLRTTTADLARLSRTGARVEVIAGELRWNLERFPDLVDHYGLTVHLHELGVVGLVFWPHLEVQSVRALLLAVQRGLDPRDHAVPGLGFESPNRTQRTRSAIREAVDALTQDPEAGLDIMALASFSGRIKKGVPRDFPRRLREHLGVARRASMEADLRRSLRADAVRLHATERGLT